MKLLIIFGIVLTASCSGPKVVKAKLDEPRGLLHHTIAVPYQTLKCKKGKPYYPTVSVTTDFTKGTQVVQFSWQCVKEDGQRVYKKPSDPVDINRFLGR